ncbi:hypothetical protein [Microbacterium halotolerans]|uniref:hypothetical protein n=1 Tax=Microbacterium halotolerans TaxID=246613 RepID=UPI000E6AE306|nr:hypothetical protein [Microbacterium halotolerans]
MIALPVALVIALGASSDRLAEYWWQEDLRIQVDRAAEGGTAQLTGVPEHRDGDPEPGDPATTALTVGLTEIERLAAIDDGYSTEPIPDGADAYGVHLAFDSGVPVAAECTVILVGDDGARYGDGSDPLHQYPACSSRDAEGDTDYGPSGQWENTFTILAAEGADIDHVRVTYDGVHYVRLDLPAV